MTLLSQICTRMAFIAGLAWLAASTFAGDRAPPQLGSAEDLYIVRRGWHVDIGFDAARVKGPVAAIARAFPGCKYLLVGFGDRRYLFSRHHAPALLAALWPGRGLMLVTALTTSPAEAFGLTNVRKIPLSGSAAAAVQEFVAQAFESDPTRTPERPWVPIAAGPYDGSGYYAAVPRYSALHTCNTWVAEVMQAAGLKVSSRGVVFAGQVWREALAFSPPPG